MRPPHRFEADFRVRFDEADANGLLRPSGFVRFAQDVAWQHSESAGFGREWYADRAVHWLVRDVDLRILEAVTYGDRLTVNTQVIGWRHVWARRRAEVRRLAAVEDGPVAFVQTDWVLLAADGRPARLPPEMAAFLAAGSSFPRQRIELAGSPHGADRRQVRIRLSDVDPMGHLNNASYVDLVDEAIARCGIERMGSAGWRYRVSYVLPALADASVEVACWIGAGAIACRISDAEGTELTRALVDPAGS